MKLRLIKLMRLISTKIIFHLFFSIFFIFILNYSFINSYSFPPQNEGGTFKDDFCGEFPKPSESKNVDEPIEVEGDVDFKFVRLVATEKLRDECSIEGSVKGKHIITIADGGSIRNLILGCPAKGIWCKGSCKLINVYWERVCYHAAGFATNDASPKVHEVTNSTAVNAPDKFFTQSSHGKTLINNFCGHKFGKVYCSCGSGCEPQYQRSVEIVNSRFKGPGLTLVSLNRNYKDTMSMSNVYIDPNPKVDYICQEYNGTTEAKGDMTPIDSFEANKAGDGQSCKYSTKEYSLKAKTDNKENNVKQENQKENKENNQKENDKTRK